MISDIGEGVVQLSSAYQPLPATAGNQGIALPATINPSGVLDGVSVSVVPTIKAFFSSLSPAYGLDNRRHKSALTVTDVAKSSGSPDKAGETAQKIKFACNVLSSWAPSVRVVTDVVTTICSSLSLAQDLGQVLDGQKANKRPSTSATISVPAGAALALVALDNLAGAAAVPAQGERGSPQNPILVLNSETLGKIGQDENYPADAYYVQGVSFSHESTNSSAVFSGHYDGNCRTISGLQTCLFREIGRHGLVRNLRLDNINIDDSLPAQGVLACTMAPFSTARDIQVEGVKVRNQANGNQYVPTATGALVGHQHPSALIIGVDLRDCNVTSLGGYTATGAIGGRIDGQLREVNVSACQVRSLGKGSPTGIGAGLLLGQIKDLVVNGSESIAALPEADAGIGAGIVMPNSSIERMSVIGSGAMTKGHGGSAGVGGGLVNGDLDQLTVVNSSVRTSNIGGFAGIGGGQVGNLGLVSNMFCVKSLVETRGGAASAGVIAGSLSGKAREVTSVNCAVITLGDSAETGVGVGFNDGEIHNFISVRDRAQNRDNSSGLVAGVDEGTLQGFSLQNTTVNGQLETVNPLANLSGLCANADPRLVDSSCLRSTPTEFSWQCAATPMHHLCGTPWEPIKVNHERALNSIGRIGGPPSKLHYVQTRDLDGAKLDGDSFRMFDGHYDGGNHIIRNQHSCLFDHLRGTVKNLQLTGARITANGKDAAVVACKMDGGSLIENIWIGNSSVTTHGPALAGLVSARRTGEVNQVSRIKIHNSSVETHADGALAGAVAGQCHGVTEQVDVHHTRVKTHGRGAHAGLGGGSVSGSLKSFATTCSEVTTSGPGAKAGMGAGIIVDGQLDGLTVVNGSLSTAGDGGDAGFGAGQLQSVSHLKNISALYTQVHTSGRNASAGVGAGRMTGDGSVDGVTGVHSIVFTREKGSNGGFGVGTITADVTSYRLSGLRSIFNVIRVLNGTASITGNLATGKSARANDSISLATWVNNNQEGSLANKSTLDSFCDFVDWHLVAPDCRINRTALPGNCAPVEFAQSPNLAVPVACDLLPDGKVTAMPPVPGNHSLAPLSLQPLTVNTPAPLIAGLSAGAVAGIVAASISFVIGAGIVACCCYHSRHQTEQSEEDSDYYDSL